MLFRRLVLGVVAVLLIGVAVVAAIYFSSRRETEHLLHASGTIEATKVDVSFQIGGRVATVSVVEGQPVKLNDVLARVSSDELTARLNQIQASLDAIVSQARQQEATLEMRRTVVENQIDQA